MLHSISYQPERLENMAQSARSRFKKMRVQSQSSRSKKGFSVIEMVVVIAVALIVLAVIFPNMINALHNYKLRGATSDLSGIVQMCRSRAIQDNLFYSVYIHAPTTTPNAPQEAFVDIYPQQLNQASGSGGLTVNSQDPVAEIPSEVTAQPQSSAPSTAALQALLLPNNASNGNITVNDASTAATPITFGPEGLPCTPNGATGSTVCNTRSGPVAYWMFLQDGNTLGWEAVTVSPAGRIEKWAYTSGSWRKL